MKIKTKDLKDKALDWAVTTCNASDAGALVQLSGFIRQYKHGVFRYSTDPAQGHPIIEREGIETAPTYTDDGQTRTGWMAIMFNDERHEREPVLMTGPTALIAAMRCRVASKLGDEVEIPEELL